MLTRDDLAREAGCLDFPAPRPGPDGRVTLGRVAEMPVLAFSTGTTKVNLTGGWKSVRPVYQDKPPPCQQGCPAGQDIARSIRAVQRGQFDEGWRLIMEDNPFPATMGRVCYHPCETVCNRRSFDQPVAIHALERFLGDHGVSRGLWPEGIAAARRERVAVIGGGPTGLAAAYHLARRGYPVTVFEAQPEVGGILRWGIPPYRLPRAILRREIARIEHLGVKVCLGVIVGRDLPWVELDRYQAILVATGLPRSRQVLDLRTGLEGLYGGLEFLRHVADGIFPKVGRQVVVIGGGNVAIDVARCAIRLGAAEVSLVCVEPEEAMPAHPEEIQEAALEGVKFHCGFAVQHPIVTNGRITGLEIARARFLGREANGGVRFAPGMGAVSPLVADTVIQAVGQEADLGFLPQELMEAGCLETDGWGRLRETMVFAAGDVLTGPARVVDAIGAGKRTAMGIHRLLTGESLPGLDDPVQAVQVGDLNLLYFAPAPTTPIPHLSVGSRATNMAEVNRGWDLGQASAEAGRCFNCGVCTGCDNCVVFCPDVAIRKTKTPYAYDVLDQYCKGCGICARECPRQVITMVPATP